MKIELLAAGTKPPAWIKEGVAEYQKRMPRECSLEIREIAIAKRSRNDSVDRLKGEEEKGIRKQLVKGARLVALDRKGNIWSTSDLANKMKQWVNDYGHIQFLIGGPDGLSESCLDQADDTWSLSRLTFPHFLARVLVAEQLYRAWSMLNNHPYHK
ncbi:MAG: 23S rRNA (pseudouridine(1915)-N(3))-methyltransferase RlmH [Gammaproteobacteria bacterium]|nr:23S rRNA (pseudouridine(1915)-N(3))-methyltransferase RlmH [Gammaproteobacteria bacterium]